MTSILIQCLACLACYFVGMGVMFSIFACRGKKLYESGEPNVHSRLLGRRCLVRKKGKWREHVIVAVSWKGALCVRDSRNDSGHGAYWVSKYEVPERVRMV